MLRPALYRLALGVSLPLSIAAAQVANPAPAVVLVSLDGFRHDYASIHNTQHLKDIGAAGTVAEALVPAFPSMTFSSHYSLITGLYAEHHGIVDNAFYDPALARDYR